MTDVSEPGRSMQVLVTGASGQLGRCLQDTQPREAVHADFLSRRQLDISDADATAAIMASGEYQYCINCAAYTAVDLAEDEHELAIRINTNAAGNLARLCKAHHVTLIHLSTDYVYHNNLRRPLRETDPTQPQSVYARSKLQGEQQVLEVHPASVILRTSWLYSEYGHNFVKTMLRLADEDRQLRVVDDQVGCPTYCRDLAEAIWQIIRHPGAGQTYSGVYNCANSGSASWYDFARAIFSAGHRANADLSPIPTAGYPTAAKRPPYGILDTSRLRADFGIEMRNWRQALASCIERLQEM